jgi:hypothetical protein
MKSITIDKFLTRQEFKLAVKLNNVDEIESRITKPNIDRINKALERECDPRYLAYVIYFVVEKLKNTKQY